MNIPLPVAILGSGNIGTAIAHGLVHSGKVPADQILLTRRREGSLDDLRGDGFRTGYDNIAAIRESKMVIIAVGPGQVDELLAEIRGEIVSRKPIVLTVVSGVDIARFRRDFGEEAPIIRAMPNTAVALGESMTCLAAESSDAPGLTEARATFDKVGRTLLIEESQMTAATSLCACGVAFFLRAIRAASQGGIEIGFHSEEAIAMASQTARGAASLLLQECNHPESEIDRVTTPLGCTIAGLNEMEHRGFSSALIKGIVKSAAKAGGLYQEDDD